EDLVYQLTALEVQINPLQRQVNQSLSHLKTIQYFINNQGSNIAHQGHQKAKAREYIRRLVSYVDQYRDYVLTATSSHVAPCKPVWDVFHAMRLLFCRHIMDPLTRRHNVTRRHNMVRVIRNINRGKKNGFWFSTVWCLVLLTVATPVSLKLVRHYKQMKHDGLLHSRSSDDGLTVVCYSSPSQTLMVPESAGPWTTPGITILSLTTRPRQMSSNIPGVINEPVDWETDDLDSMTTDVGRLYLEEVYPHFSEGRVENHFGKNLCTPDQDSNLSLSIIGSLVICERGALDHAAIKK
ncbi:unnamed protein product, partial [Timema podura]|nr:unnamed protein product [Timema podura]